MGADTEVARSRIPEWSLADRLRKVRREVLGNITQAEMADQLDIGREKYSAWESGRTSPRHRDLLKLARRIELMTGVPAAWMLGVDEPAKAMITEMIWWSFPRSFLKIIASPQVSGVRETNHREGDQCRFGGDHSRPVRLTVIGPGFTQSPAAGRAQHSWRRDASSPVRGHRAHAA